MPGVKDGLDAGGDLGDEVELGDEGELADEGELGDEGEQVDDKLAENETR